MKGHPRVRAAGLVDIAEKVEARERLSFADAVRLFEAPDLLALGWVANRERERRRVVRTPALGQGSDELDNVTRRPLRAATPTSASPATAQNPRGIRAAGGRGPGRARGGPGGASWAFVGS